jgi:hypothetical protein
MISDYINAAMATAEFEILPEDKTFYGRIPFCQGVWANEATLSSCQSELRSVLEDWLILALRRNVEIPVINNIDLNLKAAS